MCRTSKLVWVALGNSLGTLTNHSAKSLSTIAQTQRRPKNQPTVHIPKTAMSTRNTLLASKSMEGQFCHPSWIRWGILHLTNFCNVIYFARWTYFKEKLKAMDFNDIFKFAMIFFCFRNGGKTLVSGVARLLSLRSRRGGPRVLVGCRQLTTLTDPSRRPGPTRQSKWRKWSTPLPLSISHLVQPALACLNQRQEVWPLFFSFKNIFSCIPGKNIEWNVWSERVFLPRG